MPPQQSNKAKIAKRVIEVLEFFDDEHPQATVMDIVRRYKRPQSSTSELLSSLVDLGLLYKDTGSRTYTLTPRAAMLGSIAQPEIVRDGRVARLIDRLSAQTGLSVVVFGMVGLNVQIFSWRKGTQASAEKPCDRLYGGLQDRLSESAAGWLLLSTIEGSRRDGVIRRLNADADHDRKFSFPEMCARLSEIESAEHAHGPAGFGTAAHLCAVLLPDVDDSAPLAIGFVYEPSCELDPAALIECLRDGVAHSLSESRADPVEIKRLFPAASAMAETQESGGWADAGSATLTAR